MPNFNEFVQCSYSLIKKRQKMKIIFQMKCKFEECISTIITKSQKGLVVNDAWNNSQLWKDK